MKRRARAVKRRARAVKRRRRVSCLQSKSDTREIGARRENLPQGELTIVRKGAEQQPTRGPDNSPLCGCRHALNCMR